MHTILFYFFSSSLVVIIALSVFAILYSVFNCTIGNWVASIIPTRKLSALDDEDD